MTREARLTPATNEDGAHLRERAAKLLTELESSIGHHGILEFHGDAAVGLGHVRVVGSISDCHVRRRWHSRVGDAFRGSRPAKNKSTGIGNGYRTV